MSIFRCSFCDTSRHNARKLIAGPSAYICDVCVEMCVEIIGEKTPGDLEYASWFKKPNTFLIDRVTDLYNVPADKRRRCWEEVFACLHAFEDEDARKGARLCGVEWTDDDLPAMRLTVNDDTVATATLEP